MPLDQKVPCLVTAEVWKQSIIDRKLDYDAPWGGHFQEVCSFH